jgi:hypothetical protein
VSQRPRWVRNILLGLLIVGVPVLLPVVRCYVMKRADGTPRGSRIETRAGVDLLILDDEVCTGDSSQGPSGRDCDRRTITVTLPGGAKTVDTADSARFERFSPSCRGDSWVILGDARHSLTGQPPRLVRDGAAGAESLTGRTPATFKNPFLLEAHQDYVLVMDPGAASMEIAAVTGDGAARWRVRVPGVCHLARRVGDTLVVATTAPSHRGVGIDVKTGAILWRAAP